MNHTPTVLSYNYELLLNKCVPGLANKSIEEQNIIENEFNEARIDDLILQSISTLSAKNGNNNEPENINNQFSRVRSGDSRIQIINEPSIENGLYINELSSVENGYNSQTSNNPNNHNDLSRNFGELRDPW